MDIIRWISPLVYVISIRSQHVGDESLRSFDWYENLDGADQKYGPSLLTTTASSLLTCITRCSNTARCKAATYYNDTKECICLDRKTSMTSELGNRLWTRQFHGFSYNAQLEWWITLFPNTQKTQVEAESFCGSLEGRLAVVDTDEKLNYVIGLADYQADKLFFVGATDEDTERVFIWSNGNNLTTNWGPTEPNRYREENCVAIYYSAFVDLPCGNLYEFACEII